MWLMVADRAQVVRGTHFHNQCLKRIEIRQRRFPQDPCADDGLPDQGVARQHFINRRFRTDAMAEIRLHVGPKPHLKRS